MDIWLGWKLDEDFAFDAFICEAIIDGLSVLAMVVTPESTRRYFEDIDFKSLGADLAGGLIQRSVGNTTVYLLGTLGGRLLCWSVEWAGICAL